MQKFKILEFRSTNGNIRYVLNENTGHYINQDGEIKSRLDFICKQGYYVYSVKRNHAMHARTIHSELIITVNQNYLIDNQIRSISKIIIEKGEVNVMVWLENNLYHNSIINPVPAVPVPTVTIPVANTTVIGNNVVANDQFFTTLQTRILTENPRAIRLERTLRARTETPKQFLEKFFKTWNEVDDDSPNYSNNQSEKDTIYVDDSTVQTVAGKRRSLGDIFMIMRYYYSTITLKEVMKLLYVDLITNSSISNNFRTSKCNTINKRVWYYDYDSEAGIYDRTVTDEYGNNYNSTLNKLV
jgi:hypothetical protein